jgi:uncharacterized protein YbbC (DUF1343 family)
MIRTGLDYCLQQPPDVLQGRRFGVLANQASVTASFEYSWDALAARFPGNLRAIFSPQHGLWSEQQANMIESPHAEHARWNVPIYSLYSDTRRPSAAMLRELQALLIDLQDVGTRVYTFVWTMAACLEACDQAHLPVIVLDRPNPLGGVRFEGPCLDRQYASFVGEESIPMRHGLTIGELARWIVARRGLQVELHVVPMSGWRRTMRWPATRRAWIPPSPNLPRWPGVLSYPGQVLLEGTNLSEGRGLTTPFEVVGAPFIDGESLRDALSDLSLPGVLFRPVRFCPTFDKWAATSCGVFLHVTDEESYCPYRTTVSLLATVRRMWPDQFQWLPPPYEYETRLAPIDVISGSAELRALVDNVGPMDRRLESAWILDSDQWLHQISPHLLYPFEGALSGQP